MQPGRRRPFEAPAGPFSRRFSPVLDWACGLYSAVLVAATHYPRPQDFLGDDPPSDKLLHFLAYSVLGALAAAAAAARGGWNGPRVALLGLVLAGFAALDEVTQPFFSRAVDPVDWLADLAGLAAGIGAVVAWTWRGAPAAVQRGTEPGPAERPGDGGA